MDVKIPEDLLYLPTHQWLKLDGENGIIGITDYAQQELGGITWVELPSRGDVIEPDAPFASVESIKAVSDVMSPVGGKIAEVNSALDDSPELLNKDPYGDGWIARASIGARSKELMTADEYKAFCIKQGIEI